MGLNKLNIEWITKQEYDLFQDRRFKVYVGGMSKSISKVSFVFLISIHDKNLGLIGGFATILREELWEDTKHSCDQKTRWCLFRTGHIW